MLSSFQTSGYNSLHAAVFVPFAAVTNVDITLLTEKYVPSPDERRTLRGSVAYTRAGVLSSYYHSPLGIPLCQTSFTQASSAHYSVQIQDRV